MNRANDNVTGIELETVPVSTLLAEIARRFRLRYGRLEVVYHDGRPSPRVTVEHRIQQAVDDDVPTTTTSPPAPRRGKP